MLRIPLLTARELFGQEEYNHHHEKNKESGIEGLKIKRLYMFLKTC